VLSPISVYVGDALYLTEKTTFEVYGTFASPNLRLEAFIQSSPRLFPGERLKFIYRIYFKRDVELTRQDMPLFDAEGFKKIGDKQVRNYTKGVFQVQEIIQEVESVEPGKYNFPPSVLEGFFYKEDFFGQRRYEKPKLIAESDPLSITVLSFPENGRPDSFNGAVGEFTFDVSLKGDSKVRAGDKLELEVAISGSGNLSSVKLPLVSQQYEFKEHFRFSDLPSIGKTSSIFKYFVLDMRPLSATVKEIPSIEFSFFEPNQERYVTLKSNPISITVQPFLSYSEPVELVTGVVEFKTEEQKSDEELAPLLLGPIEIFGNFQLNRSSLHSGQSYEIKWALFLLPLSLIVLFAQLSLQKRREKRFYKASLVSSDTLFYQALKDKSLCLLEKSFVRLLLEKELVDNEKCSIANLPNLTLFNSIKELFTAFEVSRFAKEGVIEENTLFENAQQLFEKLKKE
jgi:hypothetical protein